MRSGWIWPRRRAALGGIMLVGMLLTGLYKAAALGAQVCTKLRHAATWAGITMAAGVEVTAHIGTLLAALPADAAPLTGRHVAVIGPKWVPSSGPTIAA